MGSVRAGMRHTCDVPILRASRGTFHLDLDLVLQDS
jgi:hypothetical protein